MSQISNIITNNLEFLVQSIDIDKLIPVLRSKQYNYLDNLDRFTTSESKTRNILEDVAQLGSPAGIDMFIHILLHTGHDSAAFLLAPEKLDLIDISRFSPIDQNGLFREDRLINCDAMSNAYAMSRPRGFCFLLNNYFTYGTHKEMQLIRNIFYHLDFDVIMMKNLDAIEIYNELSLLSKSDKLKKHSAFMFMSITHGNENAEIYGFDGVTLEIKKLVELFNNENCPHLEGSPRMFFFNCCRGYDSLNRTTTSLTQNNRENKRTFPEIEDFIICYSTLDGYEANVDWNEGTKFGKALADSFVERALYRDLNALLIRTNNKVGETRQPNTQCLSRQVFFQLRQQEFKFN